MIALASVIEQFEADYLAQYGSAALPSHRKALAAMKLCRRALGLGMLAQCSACDEQRLVPHSCGADSDRPVQRATTALSVWNQEIFSGQRRRLVRARPTNGSDRGKRDLTLFVGRSRYAE